MDGRESDTEDNTNTANGETLSTTLSTQHTESTSTEDHINAKECAQQSAEKCSQRWPKRMTTPQPSMWLLVNNACDVDNDNIVSDAYNAITIQKTMNEKREDSRDSFSRFGDDLSEELLRYVSLSDCFAFQCVSKGFKRSVFSAQKKLDTNRLDLIRTEIDETIFECALKKCLFINEIIIGDKTRLYITDRIIDIIRENCSQLTSISIYGNLDYISRKALKLFGEKCGDNLRSISFKNYDNRDSLKLLLKFTPNLVECESFQLNYLIIENVLPKLKKITATIDYESDFSSFADIYCNTVETIILKSHYYGMSFDRSSFEQLSRFRSLEILNIQFDCYTESGIDLLAKNCQKLRELSLESNSTIFEGIRDPFVSLKRLTLRCYGYYGDRDTIKVNHFKCCPNLTSLRLLLLKEGYGYGCIHSKHFTDIHHYLPQLQCFELECGDGVDQRLLISLAALKELYYIKVRVNKTRVTDIQLRNFINSSQSIREIDFNGIKSVSRRTVDAFVSHAKRSSNYHNYCLRVKVRNNKKKVRNKLKIIIDSLPNNISIDIYKK